ncbi:hypothetical protein, partial [Klebsiella pneumoniae]|uniref:hypothetical protein n=1 Tax=Klebsiella pneumoniae TaxID=573 RepID=UPI0013736539
METVFNRMKGMVSDRVRKSILEGSPPRDVERQPSAHRIAETEPSKLKHINNLNEKYGTTSRVPNRPERRGSHSLQNTRKHSPNRESAEHGYNKIGRSDTGHQSPRSHPRLSTIGSAPSTHHDSRRSGLRTQLPPLSGERRVWLPRETVPSYNKKREQQDNNPRRSVRTEVQNTQVEEYVPVDPCHIDGQSVQDVMAALKANFLLISKQKEEEENNRKECQRLSAAFIDFDPEQDDLMSEGEVFTIGTRGALAREQQGAEEHEVAVEEDATSDLTQRLMQQLETKNDQISRLEKKMEEMMAAMATLQNNQPSPLSRAPIP